jgi:hypothetical protein
MISLVSTSTFWEKLFHEISAESLNLEIESPTIHLAEKFFMGPVKPSLLNENSPSYLRQELHNFSYHLRERKPLRLATHKTRSKRFKFLSFNSRQLYQLNSKKNVWIHLSLKFCQKLPFCFLYFIKIFHLTYTESWIKLCTAQFPCFVVGYGRH